MKSLKKVLIAEVLLLLLILVLILFIDLHFKKQKETPVSANGNADVNTTVHNDKKDIKLRDPSNPSVTPAPSPKKPSVPADCLPSRYNFKWEVLQDNKPVSSYGNTLFFNAPESFSDIAGVTCFRGNAYRNSASYGSADIKEKKLEKVWSVKTGHLDGWTGVGWTGQPAIVKWDPKISQKMNIHSQKKQKTDLKEVIYAALDGNIYFLDLEDGQATRPAIETGVPHKGSVSVDPRGYPLLYAGQGIDEVGEKKMDIGFRIFNLFDQQQLYFLNGLDPATYRWWGAFDSNALVDKNTDTLIECGENGILYTIKLNSGLDIPKGKMTLRPELTKYRYHSPFSDKIGTENSPVIYRNYIYFADNSGLLQCVDLNTLSPVWMRNVNDDTDSTLVLEVGGENQVALYTACEVDMRWKDDVSFLRKINALTGELLWEKTVACYYEENVNGGVLGTPVLGKNEIDNLVIFNIARTGKLNAGKLIAYDKKTGEEMWVINLPQYSWSSPVDVYSKDGKAYILIGDSGGTLYLIEGKSGKVLDKINLEANIEASPAVYDDMLVVGTRGQKIWGIRIK